MKVCRNLLGGALAVAGAGCIMLVSAGTVLAQVSNFAMVYGDSRNDEGRAIIYSTDEEYVMAGTTDRVTRDIHVVKTDDCGNIIWSNAYDLGGNEAARSIRQGPDKNFVITGITTTGTNQGDAFLLKIQPNGSILWARNYGEAASYDIGNDLRIDKNGEIYVAGTTDHAGAGVEDGWIFKTTINGVQLWSRTYGGTNQDEFKGIELGCNEVLAVGVTRSHWTWEGVNRIDQDVFATRVAKSNGAVTWGYRYGDPDSDEWGNAVLSNGISSFYIGGGMDEASGVRRELLLEGHCAGGFLADEMTYVSANPANGQSDCEIHDIQELPGANIVAVGTWGDRSISRYDMHIMPVDALTFLPIWSNAYGMSPVYGPGQTEMAYSVVVTDQDPITLDYNIVTTGFSSEPLIAQLGADDMLTIAADRNGYVGCLDIPEPMTAIDPNFDDLLIYPIVTDHMRSTTPVRRRETFGLSEWYCQSCVPEGIIAPPTIDTPELGDGSLLKQSTNGALVAASVTPVAP